MKKNNFLKIFALTTIIGFSLCACSQGNDGNKDAFKASFDLVDVDEPFDTHTQTQNGYMSDDYTKIDDYGKGSKENSIPQSLELSWTINDAEVDLTAQRLNLYEIKDNKRVETTSYPLDKDATSASITNLKVGASYEWSITAISDDKEVESKPSSFTTVDGTVRFISIDGLSNVRDCGGWTGLNGKKIKQGLLYRGEEFNKQNHGRKGSGSSATTDPTVVDPDEEVERAKDQPYGQKITAKGIDTVLNELKLKTEVDVRGYETFDWATNVNEAPTECGGLHNGRGIILDINYVINPVHTNRDKIYYDEYGKAAVKNFFSMLADEEKHLPLYFHCAQGKDRTGFLAYLFEAFMGCSYEDMMRDYLLSNLGKTGSVSVSKLVGSSAQYNYVDYLDGKEVSTESGVKYQAEGANAAERAYNYLISCGLTSTQLDTIRNTFLED